MPKKKISRQLRWQRKQKAAGKCIQCGAKAHQKLKMCLPCGLKAQTRCRLDQECNPQEKGSRGRPRKYIAELA